MTLHTHIIYYMLTRLEGLVMVLCVMAQMQRTIAWNSTKAPQIGFVKFESKGQNQQSIMTTNIGPLTNNMKHV